MAEGEELRVGLTERGDCHGRVGVTLLVVLERAGRSAVVMLVVVGVAAGVILNGGWGDDASQETTGPYAVGTRQMTFVDTARGTPAFGASPAQSTRTLVTDLWYPARGDPDSATIPEAPAAEGPFPVIVFNHGQQGAPVMYAPSFEIWAQAGYVVAAPRHPISVQDGPGGTFVDDMVGELGDTSFVVTSIEDELSDLADVDHLAVAGHSSGAIAAFGVAFNTCCHDDRVDAVLVEGLLDVPLQGEYADDLEGAPTLFVAGDADSNLAGARAVFGEAEPPKFFLTIPGGDHSQIFRDAPPAPTVANAALAFFDRYLKDRDEAASTLEQVPGMDASP